MKVLPVLAFAYLAAAYTLAPSPTESFGCRAHNDHWQCDGARTTLAARAAVTSAAADHDHDHDHDEDDDYHHSSGTTTLKPSPTESQGCEAHGDHWHCAGPAGASQTATTTVAVTSPSSGSNSQRVAGHVLLLGVGHLALGYLLG